MVYQQYPEWNVLALFCGLDAGMDRGSRNCAIAIITRLWAPGISLDATLEVALNRKIIGTV